MTWIKRPCEKAHIRRRSHNGRDMRIINVIGSSAFEKGRVVEGLIRALRESGLSVSVVKRAPDGFDIDRPGKGSYEKRMAGAREVVLANGERMVLMRENEARGEPDLQRLLARLEPVDIVIAEGFHGAGVPTLEALRPAAGRAARWPGNPDVIALVTDGPVETPLPVFAIGDTTALASFVAERGALKTG